MQHIARFLIVVVLLTVLAVPGSALWQPPITVDSASVYIVNLDTETVIYEKDADAVRSPASLTKMMTALLVLESGADMQAKVAIGEVMREEFDLIQKENGSDAGLKIGETYTVEELFYCLLLPSANDAAAVLANFLAGSQDAFVEKMNARAKELGCTDTTFNCVHGLYEDIGDGNWSTARDMALIARAVYAYPEYQEVSSTVAYWLPFTELHTEPETPKYYKVNGVTPDVPEGKCRVITNTNVLLYRGGAVYRDYFCGMKTGFTDLAGRCLATVTQTEEGDCLMVLLGSPNTAHDDIKDIYYEAASLGDWLTANFAVGDALENAGCNLPLTACAESETAFLVPAQEVNMLLYSEDPVTWMYELPDSLTAPLSAGQVVGTVSLWRDGQCLATVDMQVDKDYEYSLFTRIKQGWNAFWKDVQNHEAA